MTKDQRTQALQNYGPELRPSLIRVSLELLHDIAPDNNFEKIAQHWASLVSARFFKPKPNPLIDGTLFREEITIPRIGAIFALPKGAEMSENKPEKALEDFPPAKPQYATGEITVRFDLYQVVADMLGTTRRTAKLALLYRAYDVELPRGDVEAGQIGNVDAHTLRLLVDYGATANGPTEKCNKALPGWRCTRFAHATGPCAAVPVSENVCQAARGTGICGFPPQYSIHTGNPYGHDFVPKVGFAAKPDDKNWHGLGYECPQCGTNDPKEHKGGYAAHAL